MGYIEPSAVYEEVSLSIIYPHVIIGGSTPLECTNGDNQVVVGLAVALVVVVVLSLIIIATLAVCLFHNKRPPPSKSSTL